MTIGSRDETRAREIARDLSAKAGAEISGLENAAAAEQGDIVVLTVPYANHGATLDSIRDHLDGKIFVDVTVPLMPPKVRTVQLPEGGSVA